MISIDLNQEVVFFFWNFWRLYTMHYWTQMNYGALLHSSMSMPDNTTKYHSGHPVKGAMPSPMLLVFLIPRQVLSSHLHQRMIWLYWLQDEIKIQTNSFHICFMYFQPLLRTTFLFFLRFFSVLATSTIVEIFFIISGSFLDKWYL